MTETAAARSRYGTVLDLDAGGWDSSAHDCFTVSRRNCPPGTAPFPAVAGGVPVNPWNLAGHWPRHGPSAAGDRQAPGDFRTPRAGWFPRARAAPPPVSPGKVRPTAPARRGRETPWPTRFPARRPCIPGSLDRES